MRTQIKEIETAITEMCDLRLKTYNFNGKTVTKEELYDLLEKTKQQNEKFKLIAIFSEKMYKSAMVCNNFDNRTLEYSVINEHNDVYSVDWQFKISKN